MFPKQKKDCTLTWFLGKLGVDDAVGGVSMYVFGAGILGPIAESGARNGVILDSFHRQPESEYIRSSSQCFGMILSHRTATYALTS